MKLLKMVATVTLCLLATACDHKQDEMYHYAPQTTGEVPAKLHYQTVTLWRKTLFTEVAGADANITQINGKYTSSEGDMTKDLSVTSVLMGVQRSKNPEITTLMLSPGPNTLTVSTAPLNRRGVGISKETKLLFDAKAGETYSFNGDGNQDNFNVWIEDSSGKKIASQSFQVH